MSPFNRIAVASLVFVLILYTIYGVTHRGSLQRSISLQQGRYQVPELKPSDHLVKVTSEGPESQGSQEGEEEDESLDLSLIRNLSASPLTTQEKWCLDMFKTHKVVPGSSWGSLPVSSRAEWKKLNCDGTIAKRYVPSDLPATREEQVALCMKWQGIYKVNGMNLKNLPDSLKGKWRHMHCSMIVWDHRFESIPLSSCANPSTTDPEDPSFEMISLLVAVTTRKMHNPSTSNLAIFHALLPSFIRTLDCGFRYSVVIGYDKDDQYFDSEKGLQEVRAWFDEFVEQPMKTRGISVKLFFRKVNNVQKKPGPVFNEMAREAFSNPDIKADFFFRVNDDSEILQKWPLLYTRALKELNPPLVGVVGPLCRQGNTRILTHDFTARVHMEIFEENYYPPPLSDWWMDDWVSFVYGSQRTFKSTKVEIVHHTGAHSTRYNVDKSHEKLLPNLVKEGKNKIANFMRKQNVDSSVVSKFVNDRFNGAPYKDIHYKR